MPEANAEGMLKNSIITTILKTLTKTTSSFVVSANSVRYEQIGKTIKFLFKFTFKNWGAENEKFRTEEVKKFIVLVTAERSGAVGAITLPRARRVRERLKTPRARRVDRSQSRSD